eukprot:NODE_155_length_16773_cov_0.488785.p1 type:complete len:634 gc:universal NODE_155_length_16773_cov_0.488785:12221-14122(+)
MDDLIKLAYRWLGTYFYGLVYPSAQYSLFLFVPLQSTFHTSMSQMSIVNRYKLRKRESSTEDENGSGSDDNFIVESHSNSTEKLGSNEFYVEQILDSKYDARKKRFQYYIKWEGFSDSENTWEDERNVSKEVISSYFQQIKKDAYSQVQEAQKDSNRNRLQYKKSLLILERIHNFIKRCNCHTSNDYILDVVKQILCGLDQDTYECFEPTGYTVLSINRFKDILSDMNCKVAVRLSKNNEVSEQVWDWTKALEICPKELSLYFLEKLGIRHNPKDPNIDEISIEAAVNPLPQLLDVNHSSDKRYTTETIHNFHMNDFHFNSKTTDSLAVNTVDSSSQSNLSNLDGIIDIQHSIQMEQHILRNMPKYTAEASDKNSRSRSVGSHRHLSSFPTLSTLERPVTRSRSASKHSAPSNNQFEKQTTIEPDKAFLLPSYATVNCQSCDSSDESNTSTNEDLERVTNCRFNGLHKIRRDVPAISPITPLPSRHSSVDQPLEICRQSASTTLLEPGEMKTSPIESLNKITPFKSEHILDNSLNGSSSRSMNINLRHIPSKIKDKRSLTATIKSGSSPVKSSIIPSLRKSLVEHSLLKHPEDGVKLLKTPKRNNKSIGSIRNHRVTNINDTADNNVSKYEDL